MNGTQWIILDQRLQQQQAMFNKVRKGWQENEKRFPSLGNLGQQPAQTGVNSQYTLPVTRATLELSTSSDWVRLLYSSP